MPNLQGEQLGWLLSPQAMDHFSLIAKWPDAFEETRRIANIVRRASLYWVAPNMTRLAVSAGARLEDFPLRAQDIPATFGMMYFQQPITELIETPDIDLAPIRVVTWKILDDRVRIQLWATGPDWLEAAGPHMRDASREIRAMIGPLVLQHEGILEFDAPILFKPENHDLPMTKYPDKAGRERATAQMQEAYRAVLAAWLLMQDTIIAEYDDQQTPRGTSKRWARAGVELPKTIRVIELRKHETIGAPKANTAGVQRYVDYRDWVKGFWRNQWYPSEGRHKPKYVADFLKGPEWAPIRSEQGEVPTVNVLKR